jgi:hypothetical protein
MRRYKLKDCIYTVLSSECRQGRPTVPALTMSTCIPQSGPWRDQKLYPSSALHVMSTWSLWVQHSAAVTSEWFHSQHLYSILYGNEATSPSVGDAGRHVTIGPLLGNSNTYKRRSFLTGACAWTAAHTRNRSLGGGVQNSGKQGTAE